MLSDPGMARPLPWIGMAALGCALCLTLEDRAAQQNVAPAQAPWLRWDGERYRVARTPDPRDPVWRAPVTVPAGVAPERADVVSGAGGALIAWTEGERLWVAWFDPAGRELGREHVDRRGALSPPRFYQRWGECALSWSELGGSVVWLAVIPGCVSEPLRADRHPLGTAQARVLSPPQPRSH